MTRRVVTAEQLDAVAADYAPPPPPPLPPVPPRTAPAPQHHAANGNGRASPVERCRAWLVKHEASIEGQHGSDKCFGAARVIWNDFGLDYAEGYPLLQEYNARSNPVWPEEGKQGLRRKWDEAVKKGPGPEGRGFKLRQDRPGYSPPSGDRRDKPPVRFVGSPPDPAGGEPRGEGKEKQKEREPKYKFADTAEFRKASYTLDWLVEYYLARGHPGVVAGPSKTLKTSLLVDLAVSLATRSPHLGKWKVPNRVKVAVVSGESGGYALQEIFFRVMRAKELPEDACDGFLKWEFALPTLADLIDVKQFAAQLAALGCTVVVIDPFYMCLGPADAKNLFEVGEVLKQVTAVLLKEHGVTTVLAHHANRQIPVGEAMELNHLAYSGLEQFVGQWVLLNRREEYQKDGRHNLWLNVGGRTGHTGLHVLNVEEGVLGEGMPQRRWDVGVSSPSDARDEAKVAKERKNAAERLERNQKDEDCVMAVVDAEAARGFPGASVSLIGDKFRNAGSGISDERIKAAVDRLIDRGALVKAPPFQKPSANGAKTTVSNGFGRPPKEE